jgi:Uma2 family endonuclease
MGLAKTEYSCTTVEEYLALERQSETRNEYLDGLIYAMADESSEHDEICTNIVGQLYLQLKSKSCRVRAKDTKVLSGLNSKSRSYAKGLYSYPDILVVCEDLRFHDEHNDVLLNPTVIIEVLSPSTEAFDRGEKFWRYRSYIETLQDYVLVSQNKPLIEHFTRYSDTQWLLATTITDSAKNLRLDSIDCLLNLHETYDRVAFSLPLKPRIITPNTNFD